MRMKIQPRYELELYHSNGKLKKVVRHHDYHVLWCIAWQWELRGHAAKIYDIER